MRSNILITNRNKAIYDDFENLFNNEGKRLDVIYQELSLKYFLEPKTISKIVFAEANGREKSK